MWTAGDGAGAAVHTGGHFLMPWRMRLLLVEDQRDLAESLWDYFERRGHTLDHAADGVVGLRLALEDRFDVIVLDLGLPRLDGLELCRQLRAAGRGTPVLMLTARDTLEDKLRGFERGADDYLVKPFALRELEARLLNLQRRHAGETVLAHGPLQLDLATRTARRDGREIALSAIQARLLASLLRAAPAVVRSETLLEQGWDGEAPGIDALHNQLRSLRAAIDRPFAQPLLHTVHGIGYRLRESPAADD
jgi:DNA-binding response OmpR family regulator